MNYKVIYSRLKTQNFTPGQRQEKRISQLSCEEQEVGWKNQIHEVWAIIKTHAYQTREPGEKEVCFSTTCVTPLESAISMHIWGRATVVDKESKKTKKRKRWRRWIGCVQKGCNEFALNERKSKHSSKFSELNYICGMDKTCRCLCSCTLLASGRKLTKLAMDATTSMTILVISTDVSEVSTHSSRSSREFWSGTPWRTRNRWCQGLKMRRQLLSLNKRLR